jgi:hypothetical protein
MVKEQHLAMKGSVAALGNLNLDRAKRFVWVVVCDEACLKHTTEIIQERCIPQNLVHLSHCCS